MQEYPMPLPDPSDAYGPMSSFMQPTPETEEERRKRLAAQRGNGSAGLDPARPLSGLAAGGPLSLSMGRMFGR
jgi:hypothetical protein